MLLASETKGDIIKFLGDRGPLAHIIAPRWVKDLVSSGISANSPERPAQWSHELPAGIASAESKVNFIVAAEDAVQERGFVAALRAQRKTRVFGIFQHVLPAILSGANGLATGQSVAGINRYALLCVPRSGSRYLAAVLSNRGMGAPREHIREPLACVITQGKLGFAAAMTALERFGQRNGIFGTKLISTFLIKSSNRRMPELNANVAWMIDRGYQFFRLERPLAETATSSYIAFLMSRWHFFGEFDEASRAKLDGLSFESSAAFEEYVRFRAEQIIVDAVARQHGIPTIAYSQIEQDIDGVVGRICAAVGGTPQALTGGAVRLPIPTRSESPTYTRFARNLAEVLAERQQDILPRTVRKLRNLTGLDKAAATRIIEEAAG